ncbi:DoxX family protein [Nocardia sp. NPDC052254]|uniref:DoxX family protein n=1 Tax=Nocardia sp. NPDC052254 TaxID=3155681 RepID=UPI0034187BB3
MRDLSEYPPAATASSRDEGRSAAVRITYRVTTAAIVAEAAVGGIWDIARIPFVRDVVVHLGYPTYFLVLLGVWKVAAAIVLAAPRLPLLKEWAYAGTFFVYTGAIVSHLTAAYARGEVVVLSVFAVSTVLSWALRPASRCLPGRQPLRMRS